MSAVGTVADLIDWVVQRALPVWADRGFDARVGRFHERLDATGAPLDVPYRSMVQARQIFVFAEACRAGWFAEGGEYAMRAMDSLKWTYADGQGDRLAFRFADHGSGADSFDSYGHAFVLLSIAALHKISPSPGLADMADGVTRFIEDSLVDPVHGGVFDFAGSPSTDKRQNPVMHLFEAYLALEESMPGRGYLERAESLLRLFELHLHDAAAGTVREHFRRDWSRHADPDLAHLVEPGHLFEWIWLLDGYGRLAGRDTGPILERLAAAAISGVTATGLVLDRLNPPPGSTPGPTHRLWPHTEAIKAAVVQHTRGHASAASSADVYAGVLGRHFLHAPFGGGWIDRIDEEGAPLSDEVPASSLYHLVLAALVAAKAFGIEPVSSPNLIR